VAVPTWIFVAGYLVVWAAAGLLVYVLVQIGSALATSLAPPERSRWAPLALGITVAAAGLYQFT
jgi:predicted metal-binding membrane protein